jgi:hypothetical protein
MKNSEADSISMLYEGLEDVTQPVVQEEARIKSAQPKPTT